MLIESRTGERFGEDIGDVIVRADPSGDDDVFSDEIPDVMKAKPNVLVCIVRVEISGQEHRALVVAEDWRRFAEIEDAKVVAHLTLPFDVADERVGGYVLRVSRSVHCRGSRSFHQPVPPSFGSPHTTRLLTSAGGTGELSFMQ